MITHEIRQVDTVGGKDSWGYGSSTTILESYTLRDNDGLSRWVRTSTTGAIVGPALGVMHMLDDSLTMWVPRGAGSFCWDTGPSLSPEFRGYFADEAGHRAFVRENEGGVMVVREFPTRDAAEDYLLRRA